MLQKENQPPARQGVMYELNLDKDQGPYLTKDIMHSNPRSITLLAGSQIIKSFTTLNQTLKFTDNKQKEFTETLSSIESFKATIKSVEQEIQISISADRKLKMEENKLRHQFYLLNEAIIEASSQLLDQYMPLLKGLQKVVKQQASLQKEQTFRMERQLKGISDSKRQILEGVFRCEQKILAIEASFGLMKHEQSLRDQ